MQAKADYGIDAPGTIRTLLLIGGLAVAAAGLFPVMPIGRSALALWPMLLPFGAVCLVEGLLMLRYARVGKFRQRDRMLNAIPWRGDEQVLDVGTGRGLLLIGAARRLTGGRAVGIDIWNLADLSGNARECTEQNLAVEGVAGRCELQSVSVETMPFPDASFDVILSNLCLHNIARRAERDRACAQIARVLKPGGVALIADFRNTRQYAEAFRSAGLTVAITGPYWQDTFPFLWTVRAEKPAPAS